MKIGFAEIDITPPLGVQKIGWIKVIHASSVLDPLYARAAVFTQGAETIGFVQLDTLSVAWDTVCAVRKRIESAYGVPGGNVMICATHNHAGPAVQSIGDVVADAEYVAVFTDKIVSVFGQAFESRCDGEVGFGRSTEFNVGYNRRIVMRDGLVKTHGNFDNPDALYVEGPLDPEVFVLSARRKDGTLLGALINFACHPAHHGGDEVLSAAWPGAMANALKAQGCAVPMFLNGAAGNICTNDPARGSADKSMAEVGAKVASAASRALKSATYVSDAKLESRSRTVTLPFRRYSDDEVKGTIRGAQRFVDPAAYDRGMPKLLDKIRTRKEQRAEIQMLSIADHDFVALPAEPFAELGLRIKEHSMPRRAVVVGYANGMVGYVPHRQAFERGGYETTFCAWSNLAPEAGDIMADAAIALIKRR